MTMDLRGLALVLLLVTSSAAGDEVSLFFMSEKGLLQKCRNAKSDGILETECLGYIMGVADVFSRSKRICIPLSTSRQELHETVLTFLEHQEQTGMIKDGGDIAEHSVESSLVAKFPCR
jgi:hypothetical protein